MSGCVNAMILAAAVLVACEAEVPIPAAAPGREAPLPTGDSLPAALDGMLYGSTASCLSDADCPSDVCYYGSCVGLLIVDARWMQETIATAMKRQVGGRPGLRGRLVAHLRAVLAKHDTDTAYRARSIVALERLAEHQIIETALAAEDPALVGAAALSLARLGRAAGLPVAMELAAGDQVPVACEALRALGSSKNPEALTVLLATLNPRLDAALLRAALDGIEALGDPRGVGPLVVFQAKAPEYLHHRVARVLRQLTGAELGVDPDDWMGWVAEHPPLAAPEVTLRTYSAEDTLGLPTP